jgi:hypothetical protein
MQQDELYRQSGVSPPDAYERSDLNARWVLFFGIGVLCATILAALITAAIIYYKAARNLKREVALPSPASEREINVQPRLDVDAPRQLREMRAAEDARLSGYGWIDQEAGIVRIPIDRAMDILASKGLPARKPEASAR